MDWLLGRLSRLGLRRGLGGEHAAWLVIALAALVLRRARRPGPPVTLSLPIKTGDRLLVTLVDPSAPSSPNA
jgi:hypothetical protein